MSLDTTFAALGDPTRRAILARLAQGEATVSELARPHDLSQPTISKHLKVLERAGLIETRIDAQSRPRRLVPGALDPVNDWLGQLRHQWERRLDRFEEFLESHDDGKGAP
jgi:DNA-binding transcriptional ArsR family regulator